MNNYNCTKNSLLRLLTLLIGGVLTLAVSAVITACAGLQPSSEPLSLYASEGFSVIPHEIPSRGLLMDDPIANFGPVEIDPSLDWPVDRARLTRGFLPNARPRPHLGLDLASNKGTPIYAALDGTVIYAGSGFRGYGRFIIVENELGWATFYGHLDKMLVKNGEHVEKGQKIGKMGRTGRATGTHLHFEVRKDKKAIDPLAFLPRASDWVNN
jgi:murein DD-endopeptidase MepM/ murein hydrolase activator NlpD